MRRAALNAEDRRRLEQLQLLHRRAVESAQPGTMVSLNTWIDRHGHISLAQSHVLPQIKVPSGVESETT